jgi:hypothetical protein
MEVDEGLEEDAAEEVEALLVAAVAGLVLAGAVPVLLPQPVRAAARARIASPGPTWWFMVCSLVVFLGRCFVAGVRRRSTGR